MQPLGNDLWVVEAPQRFFGASIGTRMTVVKLGDGRLWLCSPVPLDDALGAQLEALGPVGHLVGPNRFHHLSLGAAAARFAEAAVWLAPGLAEKVPGLSGSPLDDDSRPWGDEIDLRVLQGVPTFNEVAFFHRASRTLVLTDHLFHLPPAHPGVTPGLGWVLGVSRAPGFPRDAKWFFVKDQTKLRTSLEAILSWDFERIVFAHGKLVERHGREVLRRAYAHLWKSGRG